MEINNLFPAFQTEVSQYAVGVKNSIFTFIGFEVALFYAVLLNDKTAKKGTNGSCESSDSKCTLIHFNLCNLY